jgi:hypothetical protein
MESKRETQKLSIGKAKASIQRARADTVIRKGLAEVLPTSVQKSYFMLTDAERGVLNTALEEYRPGQSEPILVGGENLLKPALRLMTDYRSVVEFSPRFERNLRRFIFSEIRLSPFGPVSFHRVKK